MALVLVLVFVLPPSETPSVSPPPPVEPIKLVFNDHNPEGTGPALAMDYWAEKVEEESGGRLEITVYHMDELFTGDEIFGAVQSSGCDGGHYIVSSDDGFLLSNVMSLPFMGWPEQHVEDAYQTLLDEFPKMAAEWEGVTILSLIMMPPTHIHTVDIGKVITTPGDIAGVKMFCNETSMAEIMDAVGATVVEMPITEMAPSVHTGLADGVFHHFPVCNIFGALEFLKCHTIFGDGGINMTPMFLIMNTDVLNSLPSDLQDIILNSGHYWYDEFKVNDDAEQAEALAYCEENNHTFTYLTDEEIRVWRDTVKDTFIDAWIAECEAAGLPGQALYYEVLRLIAEWQ